MNNVAGEAGAMPLLRLSEAAAQCARETGEQVTSDWLLQFAGKGQLKISFIARTVIPLEGGAVAGTSIIYNIGDYINLPPEWASWMHGSIEKPRTIELSLLPTPSGPRYIKDALTGKRITIEVREEDLYVSFEEISSMASTLLERRKKDNEKRKPLHQKLGRDAEEKRKVGRYTLAEAALCIASSAGERKEVIERKLVKAVKAFQLPAYEPGRRAKMEYTFPMDGGGFIGSTLRMKSVPPSDVSTFYEEVYWDDLNKWLIECEDRIAFRFPEPEVTRHEHDALLRVGKLPQEDSARALAKQQAAYDETGLNGTTISWHYWVHQMPSLTAAQAARLMSGLEPDLFDNLNNRPGKDDPTREIKKAIKIQRLAEAQGKLTASPAEWVKWASMLNLSVYVGFRMAVEEIQEATKTAMGEECNKEGPKVSPVSPAVALLDSGMNASTKPANVWDEYKLRKLLNESNEPGMTHQKLAEQYGVSRQRIGILLKDAREKFEAPKKTNAFGSVVNTLAVKGRGK